MSGVASIQSAPVRSVQPGPGRSVRSKPLVGVRLMIVTSGHYVSDARVYARHARSMSKLGANVVLVGSIHHSVPNDVRILTVSTPSGRWSRFLFQPWKCLWRARGEKCDVLHFHDAEMLSVLPIAKFIWRRAAFVYDVHEDFANLMLIRNWLPPWAKPVARAAVTFAEGLLSRLADAVVAVTPPLTRKFNSRMKRTAFNFPTADFYQRCAEVAIHPKFRAFDIVHLGTLNARRASFLCDVLAEVCRSRTSSKILVVGARPEMADLISTRLSEHCKILSITEYSEIPGLLGSAKVGIDVHPWNEPHLRVAVPVKVFEYMAAGCAVVCSSMPMLDDLLAQANAGSKVDVIQGGAAADYAQAILKRLYEIDSGSDPGAELRQLASRHMLWEGEARKIATLYLKLLRRKRKSS